MKTLKESLFKQHITNIDDYVIVMPVGRLMWDIMDFIDDGGWPTGFTVHDDVSTKQNILFMVIPEEFKKYASTFDAEGRPWGYIMYELPNNMSREKFLDFAKTDKYYNSDITQLYTEIDRKVYKKT